MNEPLSIIHLITGASTVVQLVMLLLLLASVVSWWFIFSKWQELKAAQTANSEFAENFWQASNLKVIYDHLEHRQNLCALEDIFVSGYREYLRQSQFAASPKEMVAASERVMRVSLAKHIDSEEMRLGFLATVGSTSPYVGLFGTVIGIMNAFRGLGNARQATLSMVAPGIAEALVATAIGLLAAIPAVVAYNKFAAQVERNMTSYENFKDEFAALINRQAKAQASQQ